MQETIEEERNLSRNKRKGGKIDTVKRKLRKKVKIILSIVISKKYGKTRELNRAMPCNIDYTGLLIYILMTNNGG